MTPSFFEDGTRTPTKQEFHTAQTSEQIVINLKSCLTSLVHHLFGKGIYPVFDWNVTEENRLIERCRNEVDRNLFSIYSSILWTGGEIPG